MSSPQTEPLIRVRGLRKTFGTGDAETPVLKGIDLDIWQGKFTAIIGSSGSGKSTLLNMLALLDRPTAGSIIYQGKDLATLPDEERAAMRSKIFGFVFQQYNLMPWLDAHDNVTLPTLFSERPLDAAWVQREFESIGLTDRMDHYPTQMSGGEQQRVAILRALVNDPAIIIGDEPTGNLDSATGNKILDMLLKLNREKGKTLIIVTHDADIAHMADQIITIKDGILVRDGVGYQQLYTE
jgi:ABC-type lipoprotein export system ATPase subunit